MQISFKVDGVTQLSRNLRVFVDNLQDMKPFYSDALDIIKKRSDSLFQSNGRNLQKGPKWKPLAPSTNLARSMRTGHYKKKPNKPGVLRWTGRLQEDVTKIVNNKGGSLTRNAPYAIYHQKGGGNLPKRPIIDLDNNTNAELIRALQKKIEKDQGIFGLQA